VRAADAPAAARAIAGYTVMNDVSVRDWQWRTTQWLQGKTWEATTPLGPWLVTADELDPEGAGHPDVRVTGAVDEALVQDARTSELVFDLAISSPTCRPSSRWCPATSSRRNAGGVGSARTPAR
jgi:acylpyruvate hydrolase